MAVSYIWPGSLPQEPMDGYSETGGVLLIRTPMSAGPAKMRRIGKRPPTLMLSFYMSSAQVATLETFVQDTIKGTIRFGFPHPRTGVQIEARFVPSEGGELYKVSYIMIDLWSVSMTLEALP